MDQVHFSPRSTSEEFLRRLRTKYPHVPLAKLVRAVYSVGEVVVQTDPKRLQEALQADKRAAPR